jgi:hypothetical protein
MLVTVGFYSLIVRIRVIYKRKQYLFLEFLYCRGSRRDIKWPAWILQRPDHKRLAYRSLPPRRGVEEGRAWG